MQKKLKHSLYGHPHSKQCKANPITVDRTSFWNMHFCLRVIFVNIKTSIQPFNLQMLSAWEYFTTALRHESRPFLCCPEDYLFCYFCFTCQFFLFFRFYGNDHNNLIWFVRQNKWESVEQIWKGCFEFWLKEKKIPLFLSFFCTPTNLATWHGQSQCEVAFLRYSHPPPHTRHGAKFPQL